MRVNLYCAKISPCISEKLKILEEQNLLRQLKDRESPQGPRIVFEGKEYVNFSSNDYLGLANHPYMIEKVKECIGRVRVWLRRVQTSQRRE